ncbi:MAG: diguanylate cyclase [Spirochaetaceae bacterium]|nr:diguanylate cyclase [Spirochaetaceae bacterium]
MSLIQIFIEGISLNWAMYTYTVFLTFVLLEKSELNRDALTNFPFRNQFMRRLEYDIRNRKPFTLMTADLNDFKAINDRFGHQEGDQVLSYTAALREHNAENDGYRISLSYGWKFNSGDGPVDKATILNDVDQKMYADKARRKG